MSSDGLLVDTDVFSYVARRRPEANAFIPLLRDRILAVSFATVGELFCGAATARWGEKRIVRLETILQR